MRKFSNAKKEEKTCKNTVSRLHTEIQNHAGMMKGWIANNEITSTLLLLITSATITFASEIRSVLPQPFFFGHPMSLMKTKK